MNGLWKAFVKNFAMTFLIPLGRYDFFIIISLSFIFFAKKDTMSSSVYFFTVLILTLCSLGPLVKTLCITHLLSRKLKTNFYLSYPFCDISLVNCSFHSFSCNKKTCILLSQTVEISFGSRQF